MNNQEKEKEKETFPQTPYVEKEKEKFAVSVSVIRTRARGTGTGTETGNRAGPTETETVDLRRGLGTETEKRPRLRICRDFIMNTDYDAIQVALITLNVPAVTIGENGKPYRNATLWRGALAVLGEDLFREILYLQWRENEIDGNPRNRAATFQAKLKKALREVECHAKSTQA